MKRIGDKWEVIAAGPTTSSRMAFYVEDVVCKAGVKMIIGKGGMNDEALEVFKKCKCVYCSYTGGVAVLAAMSIKRVVDVKWLDLGVPEAMWILEVEDFGPLLVTMDCRGRSLYSDIEAKVRGNKAKVLSMFS